MKVRVASNWDYRCILIWFEVEGECDKWGEYVEGFVSSLYNSISGIICR